jgi:hypothetical protein
MKCMMERVRVDLNVYRRPSAFNPRSHSHQVARAQRGSVSQGRMCTTLLTGGQCLDQEETQGQRPGKNAAQHSQALAPQSEQVGGRMCTVDLFIHHQ